MPACKEIPEERRICCYRVSWCAKSIALIQIVFGAVAGGFLILKLSDLVKVPHLPLLVSTGFVQLACNAVGVVMGIILLISAFKKCPKYLDAWTIMAVIFFIFDTICTILSTVAEEIMTPGTSSSGRIVVLIIKLLAMACMFRFGIYVVQSFKSDIEQEEEELEVDHEKKKNET